jgi:hypothetical protein
VVNTISTAGTPAGSAIANNNLGSSLTSTTIGNLMIVVSVVRSSSVSVTGLSGGGCSSWTHVAGPFVETTPTAQTFDVFFGQVTTAGASQAFTATG